MRRKPISTRVRHASSAAACIFAVLSALTMSVPFASADDENAELELFRKAIQEELSADNLLRGTRVDRVVNGADQRLDVKGVSWIPEGMERPPLPDDLRSRISATILQVLARPRWTDLQKRSRVVVDSIAGIDDLKPVPNPLGKIRELVSATRELDGVRVDEAFYDASGALVIQGIVLVDDASPAGAQGKMDTLKSLLQTSLWATWLGTELPRLKGLVPLRANIVAGLEDAMRRAILSTHPFADPDVGFHDKVRIDRVYYNETNQLTFKGQRWNELPTEAQDKQQVKLHQFVSDVVGKYWPTALFPPLTAARRPDDPDSRLSVEGIAPFNNSDPARRSALAHLWTLIPRHEQLDGIRVDRAYYQGGVLHLTGLQARPNQTVELQRYIDRTNVLWKTLAPGGIEFDSFRELPIHVLKSRVQTRLASNGNISGARIQRVYYDYDGQQIRLKFEIERWAPASSVKAGSSDAESSCDNLPDDDPIKIEIQAELDGNVIEWAATRELGKEPCYKIIAERSDLLAVLKKEIPLRKEMDGVRLDRAFYDANGGLHFAGLIGRDEQLGLVEQLVRQTVVGNEVWEQYVRDGWAVEREHFELLPIDPMLACVQHILPGYEELDGSAVVRLYHDADGQLAVAGRVASLEQKKELGRILAKELWRVAPGRRRLEVNFVKAPVDKNSAATDKTSDDRLNSMTVVPLQFEAFPFERDFYKAQSMLGDAWQLYWKSCYSETIELLNMALSYDSKCVGAWYLRALCYIQLNEIPLARRDIRRAVLINKGSSYRLNARHGFLTRVQGEPRTCFERLFHEALFSRPNGSLISELCEDCDCYGPRSRTCIHCRQERLPSGLPCPHFPIVPGCTTCTSLDGHNHVTQSESTMQTVLAISKGMK